MKYIVMICPSYKKPCGIAKYCEYIQECFFENSLQYKVIILRAAKELKLLAEDIFLNLSAILVQHEYGLFERKNHLSEGITEKNTIKKLKKFKINNPNVKIAFIIHTFSLLKKFKRINELLIHSGFDTYVLNSTCAKIFDLKYLEHGFYIPSYSKILNASIKPKNSRPVFGIFGLNAGSRNLKVLFSAVNFFNAILKINIALSQKNAEQQKLYIANLIKENIINHQDVVLTFEYLKDYNLVQHFADTDVMLIFQHDALTGSHFFNTSGSARFTFNFGVPIIALGYTQMSDIENIILVQPQNVNTAIQYALENRERIINLQAEHALKNTLSTIYTKLIIS